MAVTTTTPQAESTMLARSVEPLNQLTNNMTKEEVKEVMEEMECWSCDNHLNICDKHTCRDNEAKECKHEDKDACIDTYEYLT